MHGSEIAAREHIEVQVYEKSSEVSRRVAAEVATLIRAKAAKGEMCVLGLPTGSTPSSVYNELVRMHREEGLSFANVISFNLDEYFPMQPQELQSYVRFMREHLFDHVDIRPENAQVPDGTLSVEQVDAFCQAYEQRIAEAGGIDLQLLGIGRTGHIGFNEPGSPPDSRTRMIWLDEISMAEESALPLSLGRGAVADDDSGE